MNARQTSVGSLVKDSAGAVDDLRGRIDWIMKRSVLEEALVRQPDWNWHSSEVTYLDRVDSNLDPDDSLFLALDGDGLFEPVASAADIARYVVPPDNTRRGRGNAAPGGRADRVTKVDWDQIGIKMDGFPSSGSRAYTFFSVRSASENYTFALESLSYTSRL